MNDGAAVADLVQATERHVRRCKACRGTGTIKEFFQAFQVVESAGDWILRKAVAGRGVRRDPCPDCGPMRIAIRRVQEQPT